MSNEAVVERGDAVAGIGGAFLKTTPSPPNNLLKYPKFAGGVVYSETHFQLSQTKHCAIIVANFAGCRVGISLTVVVRETNSAR